MRPSSLASGSLSTACSPLITRVALHVTGGALIKSSTASVRAIAAVNLASAICRLERKLVVTADCRHRTAHLVSSLRCSLPDINLLPLTLFGGQGVLRI